LASEMFYVEQTRPKCGGNVVCQPMTVVTIR
jgi:hypothetical protein